MAVAGLALTVLPLPGTAQDPDYVDLSLVVAIDSSQSVDDRRYQLQIEGIAAALEDKAVQSAILSGLHGAINFTVVAWADATETALAWTRIENAGDAHAVAERIRKLPKKGGEFTCLGRMLRNLRETVLDTAPSPSLRTVVDVSGDGVDNCDRPNGVALARDDLVDSGVTVNGLPIITEEGEVVGAGAYRAPGIPMELLPRPNNFEKLTLDVWYKRNVIGGAASFIKPAYGYEDFGRAMRQKFVKEISHTPEQYEPKRSLNIKALAAR
jgi:Protein of unknown function (DUF1194)